MHLTDERHIGYIQRYFILKRFNNLQLFIELATELCCHQKGGVVLSSNSGLESYSNQTTIVRCLLRSNFFIWYIIQSYLFWGFYLWSELRSYASFDPYLFDENFYFANRIRTWRVAIQMPMECGLERSEREHSP